ncbi:glutathione S-transferase PM239X14 [Aspergillus udagawae]|uniref:Glutathione S-transferase PM239X14 n=1 Tax=Aspergillus udagawae TaxID=91492 RepID=A0ABQ1AI13_9EURO|nr:glutathione S-transferase PM239X14 [Aspergillus udagawae]GFF82261.1 glutathione S-transferase PM239X14 [Aspergillus udagawae]GFG05798.1 glutathione S-transferase PM239X14 [Aspergillus udagawae]
MNILKAVSWACRAWHIDMDSRNIRNCSRRSGWLGISSADQAEEDEEEYKAAKQQLRDTVEMLAQMNFLHKAMEIDTFISPPFESPEGAWIEEEQMQTQTGSVEIPEGDSDEEVV